MVRDHPQHCGWLKDVMKSVPIVAWIGLLLAFFAFGQATFMICRNGNNMAPQISHRISNDPRQHGIDVSFKNGSNDQPPFGTRQQLLDRLAQHKSNGDLGQVSALTMALINRMFPAKEDHAVAHASITSIKNESTSRIKAPIVVAHCEGRNVAHIPDQRQYGLMLIKAAFPERVVVYNDLDEWCNATNRTKYDIVLLATIKCVSRIATE